MALVRDPRTGQLIEVPDEQVQGAVGPQGRAQPARGLAAATVPLAGPRGGGAVIPQTVFPTAAGPRGTGPVITQPPARPITAPAATPAITGLAAAAPAAEPSLDALRASRDAARGVREQDRANVAQFVESQPGFVGAPTPSTTLSPDILADANQRIAQTLREGQSTAPLPGAERGVFNQETTSRVGPDGQITSTLPRPQSEGLTGLGQFGGQSASDYLAAIRAQDQAATTQRQQRSAEARIGLERSTLQREATQGTGNTRLAARQALNAFEAQQLQATQEAGATERTGLTVAAQQEQARQQAAANVLAAQAQAQGQLGAAQLRGQFGLQEAQTAAQGRIGAAGVTATSPQARLAEARARQLQIQEELVRQSAEAGEVGATFAAAGLQQPRAVDVATNALGQPVGTYDARGRFVPYTPEELRAAQQAFAPTPQ